jgi:hypothetical protein
MHSAQAENYYNFAQARGNYKGDALTGLREAISSRIEAVKSGSAFGADGSLEGDQVNNVTILSDKKRLAKKGVGTNQDTTEWSKYYLSKLVGQLKPYQKDTSATDWNPEKHGFAAYLAGQGVNAQDVFEQYDIRDPKNPTAARSYTERKELLKGHLAGYQQWLTGKGFDFTKNSSEWDDSTMTDLSTLIEGYDAMDNRALSTYLRKLGAGDDYTTAFTSDRWDMSKPASESIEEATAEAERLAAEEAERQRSEYLRQAQDDFLNAYTVTAGSYYKPHDYSTHEFAKGVTPSFMNYYTSLTGNNRNQFGTYIGSDENAWNKAYQGLMTSFKGGEAYNTSTNPEARIVLQRFFENAPNGFTVRRREIEGNIDNNTFFEAIVYAHTYGYENYEYTVELGLFACKSAANNALTIFRNDNECFFRNTTMEIEEVVNFCQINRRYCEEGFVVEEFTQ